MARCANCTGAPRQRAFDIALKCAAVELRREQIDADADWRETHRTPGRGAFACGLQDFPSDLGSDRTFDKRLDERGGRKDASLRMPPAQQGLRADDCPVVQAHLGLARCRVASRCVPPSILSPAVHRRFIRIRMPCDAADAFAWTTDATHVADREAAAQESMVWIEPKLSGAVEVRGVTEDGMLRHSGFQESALRRPLLTYRNVLNREDVTIRSASEERWQGCLHVLCTLRLGAPSMKWPPTS